MRLSTFFKMGDVPSAGIKLKYKEIKADGMSLVVQMKRNKKKDCLGNSKVRGVVWEVLKL